VTWLDAKWLWALLVLPVLAFALIAWGRDRRRAAARYADPALLDITPPRRVRALRAAAAVMVLLAAGLGILAMARPAMTQQTKENRSTVMLAIDTSKSMLKTDLTPSRLEAAVDAANRFLDAAPEDAAVGLVTFDSGARVRVAATTDRAAVRQALENLPIGVGTAIGDAVQASLQSIQASGVLAAVPSGATTSSARILLLTDGDNSAGSDPLAAAMRASDMKVPIYTVLLGNDPGRVNQLSPTEALSTLAARTGGVFTQSTSTDDLVRVYQDIGAALASIEKLEELTVWAVLAAMVLMLVAVGLIVVSELGGRTVALGSVAR